MLKPNISYKLKFPGLIYFVTIFLLLLLTGVYLIYEFNKELTISSKKQFIGKASANLVSANQSINELAASLKLTDANYEKVTSIQGKSTNYDIIIEDNQKSLNQVGTITKSLDFQKNLIAELKPPKGYAPLKVNLMNFYDNSQQLLSKVEKNLEFENKVLEAVSAGDDIQVNTQAALWQEGNQEKIIAYFQGLKDEANGTLTQLLTLKPSVKYESYYSAQISYFKFISAKSEEIINILTAQNPNPVSPDDATSLEVAYKSALDFEAQLNDLSKQLEEMRSVNLAIDNNKEDFEALILAKKELEKQVKSTYQNLYLESTKGFYRPF